MYSLTQLDYNKLYVYSKKKTAFPENNIPEQRLGNSSDSDSVWSKMASFLKITQFQ